VSGAVLRLVAPAEGRSIGRELDITASYRFGRHVRLDAGFGHFDPAGALRRSASGGGASTWAFASTDFTF
jgi:hypothetical protein